MKIKTSEMIGRPLDWAVAVCEGGTGLWHDTIGSWWMTINGKDRVLSGGWSDAQNFQPSSDGRLAVPIIEREKISIDWSEENQWCASCDATPELVVSASTPLIAAMRCYVASKLGDWVDVPDELI